MSLLGALNLGSTALSTQQAALQVTGNNIANAGNDQYTRRVAGITDSGDQQLDGGIYVGTGVRLTGVARQVDDALNARLRASTSDNEAAGTAATWAGQLQTLLNPLGDTNLSTSMSTFFGDWSNLSNKPQDASLRQIVVQDGQTLADQFRTVSSGVTDLQTTAAGQLSDLVGNADALASKIAALNGQISNTEAGTGGTANGLRDQRDADLSDLSKLVNVQTADAGNGIVNVYIGSVPLVQGTLNRGLEVKPATPAAGAAPSSTLGFTVNFKIDGGPAAATSGQIGGLLAAQQQLGSARGQVDTLASNLIFNLNKIHSGGQGTNGITDAVGTNAVSDPTAALDSGAAGLAFAPNNGSFVVHVKDAATGLSTSTLVQVKLTGAATDTTLDSLVGNLNAISGVSASVVGGKLEVKSAVGGGSQITFSQDSSGTLAALGLNTFFAGTDASSIAVNPTVSDDPSQVAAAQNGDAGDNQTALKIATLETTGLASLGGSSLRGTYKALVNGVATSASSAQADATATAAIKDTLTSQRDSLSGVSLDEEAINLLRQQRAYQGAARFVSAVDDMMKTLLAIT